MEKILKTLALTGFIFCVSLSSFAETRRCPICTAPNPGRVLSEVNINPSRAKATKSAEGVNSSRHSVEDIRAASSKVSQSRGARLEAMDKVGVPKSQQPISQGQTASGRHYTYETTASGGGKQQFGVQQQTLDRNHLGQPHWEAGPLKPSGEVNRYGVPRLDNSKVKVEY